MRSTRFLAIALTSLAVLTSSAESQTTQVKMKSAGSTVSHGVYVGAYRGQIGSGPGAATVDLFCVDYLNHSWVGATWTANRTSLGGGTDLSNTRFGGLTNSLVRYRMAAWLTTQFAAAPPTQWGDIHATIWHLMTPTSPNYSADSQWLAAAQQFYDTNTNEKYWNRFQVLSDVAMGPEVLGAARRGGIQEFIIVTPEPATILLLGTGLLLVVGLGYKRFV
jgi:PEP-CTERM motif